MPEIIHDHQHDMIKMKKMDIEELSRILHDGNKKAVEQGSVLSRKKCTYVLPMVNPVVYGERYICDGGELFHAQGCDDGICTKTRLGKKCPRCGGSGFEPFLTWDEITDEAREGRRIQANHVNDAVILPLENEIHELEERIHQLIDELKKYKTDDSGYINQMW